MDPPPYRYFTPLFRSVPSASQIPPPVTSSVDGASRQTPVPRLRRLTKEERERRYDRIERLTKELTLAVKDEMARRKDSWDMDGDKEEEEQWENRKNEVYGGLGELAGDIQRAFRDRDKEAILEQWVKEEEERRVRRSGGTR